MINEMMELRVDGINRVLAQQGADFRAEVTSVFKPNQGEKSGYILRALGDSDGVAQPILYWEPIMEVLNDDDLADQMIHLYSRRPEITVPELSTAYIAEHVMSKVLSEEHADELSRHNIPFVRIPETDLISYFYLPVEGLDGTVTITKAILQSIPMSVDAVYKYAGRNAVNNMIVRSMFATLADISGMEVEDTDDGLYVVTTKDNVFGAGVMAGGRDAFERMGQAIHADRFFILPSSIHELLIVRDDYSTGFTFEALLEMVTEINEHEVAPQDRLVDNVYHYDMTSGELSHCR